MKIKVVVIKSGEAGKSCEVYEHLGDEVHIEITEQKEPDVGGHGIVRRTYPNTMTSPSNYGGQVIIRDYTKGTAAEVPQWAKAQLNGELEGAN